MLRARFGELEWTKPQIACEIARRQLILQSETSVWGVCLDVDGEADYPDNAFDLLPGLPYTLPWRAGWGKLEIAQTGKGAMLRGQREPPERSRAFRRGGTGIMSAGALPHRTNELG